MYRFASWRSVVVALVTVVILSGAVARAADEPIDWNRARQLYQREQRGDKLSAPDQAYLDRAKEEERRKGQPQPGTRPGQMAPKETTGLVPLTQLGEQKYKGEDGGLYGGGKNTPPEAQLKLAMAAVAKIAPLDATGKPAADGRIVMLGMGMSNTTQEFSMFKQLADRDERKSPKLLIVNGAQGGKDAAAWTNNAGDKGNAVWDVADQRMKAAGATAEQVQVIFIKQALIQQGRFGEFPDHAKVLQQHLETTLAIAKNRYPNVKLAYLSSRIYAGYAATQLNPEPYAYEGAFSIRWVIQDQLKGDGKINCDPAKGDVKAPVALWGPYLWADGTKGRQLDELVYKREDLGPDGTHPSDSGRKKVAEVMLKFFKEDATTKTWFAK